MNLTDGLSRPRGAAAASGNRRAPWVPRLLQKGNIFRG